MVQYKYIIQAIEKSYSHKPHLAELPYDLNTNNVDKLKERLRACNRELRDAQSDLKYAKENVEMMNDNINEIEENEKIFKADIKKMEEENAQIRETIGKVYDHFEDVTMMTEEDGWQIKKQYEKLQQSSPDTDFSDIDENMKEFIDEVSLLGYIPDTYPKDDSIRPQYYIETKLNPMIDKLKKIDSPEAQKLATQMENYIDKYDMGKDTPLTQELKKIEEEGNLSDIWYITEEKNNKEIGKITNTIDKENERKEGIIEKRKDEQKLIRKLETKVNDFKTHKDKIQEKIDKVSG